MRDLAQIMGDGLITMITDKALTMLDVETMKGLDYVDQKILRTMIEMCIWWGPVGLGNSFG